MCGGSVLWRSEFLWLWMGRPACTVCAASPLCRPLRGFPAVLARSGRRRTHCVHFAHFVQTAATSQFTKRVSFGTRARPRCALRRHTGLAAHTAHAGLGGGAVASASFSLSPWERAGVRANAQRSRPKRRRVASLRASVSLRRAPQQKTDQGRACLSRRRVCADPVFCEEQQRSPKDRRRQPPAGLPPADAPRTRANKLKKPTASPNKSTTRPAPPPTSR